RQQTSLVTQMRHVHPVELGNCAASVDQFFRRGDVLHQIIEPRGQPHRSLGHFLAYAPLNGTVLEIVGRWPSPAALKTTQVSVGNMGHYVLGGALADMPQVLA